MPRKAKDDAEEKMPRPKVLFKMNYQIFDNGVIDSTLFERFENEETGRWKQQTCNTPQDFIDSVEREICESPEILGSVVLSHMGIDARDFARKVLGIPPVTIPEQDEVTEETDNADVTEYTQSTQEDDTDIDEEEMFE